ncbi:hypothetical protein DIPPA_00109 [Diplonema papillatum]|nr:hypothetical protein DIPPA_00109 [Diplonema papillatum]
MSEDASSIDDVEPLAEFWMTQGDDSSAMDDDEDHIAILRTFSNASTAQKARDRNKLKRFSCELNASISTFGEMSAIRPRPHPAENKTRVQNRFRAAVRKCVALRAMISTDQGISHALRHLQDVTNTPSDLREGIAKVKDHVLSTPADALYTAQHHGLPIILQAARTLAYTQQDDSSGGIDNVGKIVNTLMANPSQLDAKEAASCVAGYLKAYPKTSDAELSPKKVRFFDILAQAMYQLSLDETACTKLCAFNKDGQAPAVLLFSAALAPHADAKLLRHAILAAANICISETADVLLNEGSLGRLVIKMLESLSFSNPPEISSRRSSFRGIRNRQRGSGWSACGVPPLHPQTPRTGQFMSAASRSPNFQLPPPPAAAAPPAKEQQEEGAPPADAGKEEATGEFSAGEGSPRCESELATDVGTSPGGGLAGALRVVASPSSQYSLACAAPPELFLSSPTSTADAPPMQIAECTVFCAQVAVENERCRKQFGSSPGLQALANAVHALALSHELTHVENLLDVIIAILHGNARDTASRKSPVETVLSDRGDELSPDRRPSFRLNVQELIPPIVRAAASLYSARSPAVHKILEIFGVLVLDVETHGVFLSCGAWHPLTLLIFNRVDCPMDDGNASLLGQACTILAQLSKHHLEPLTDAGCPAAVLEAIRALPQGAEYEAAVRALKKFAAASEERWSILVNPAEETSRSIASLLEMLTGDPKKQETGPAFEKNVSLAALILWELSRSDYARGQVVKGDGVRVVLKAVWANMKRLAVRGHLIGALVNILHNAAEAVHASVIAQGGVRIIFTILQTCTGDHRTQITDCVKVLAQVSRHDAQNRLNVLEHHREIIPLLLLTILPLYGKERGVEWVLVALGNLCISPEVCAEVMKYNGMECALDVLGRCGDKAVKPAVGWALSRMIANAPELKQNIEEDPVAIAALADGAESRIVLDKAQRAMCAEVLEMVTEKKKKEELEKKQLEELRELELAELDGMTKKMEEIKKHTEAVKSEHEKERLAAEEMKRMLQDEKEKEVKTLSEMIEFEQTQRKRVEGELDKLHGETVVITGFRGIPPWVRELSEGMVELDADQLLELTNGNGGDLPFLSLSRAAIEGLPLPAAERDTVLKNLDAERLRRGLMPLHQPPLTGALPAFVELSSDLSSTAKRKLSCLPSGAGGGSPKEASLRLLECDPFFAIKGRTKQWRELSFSERDLKAAQLDDADVDAAMALFAQERAKRSSVGGGWRRSIFGIDVVSLGSNRNLTGQSNPPDGRACEEHTQLIDRLREELAERDAALAAAGDDLQAAQGDIVDREAALDEKDERIAALARQVEPPQRPAAAGCQDLGATFYSDANASPELSLRGASDADDQAAGRVKAEIAAEKLKRSHRAQLKSIFSKAKQQESSLEVRIANLEADVRRAADEHAALSRENEFLQELLRILPIRNPSPPSEPSRTKLLAELAEEKANAHALAAEVTVLHEQLSAAARSRRRCSQTAQLLQYPPLEYRHAEPPAESALPLAIGAPQAADQQSGTPRDEARRSPAGGSTAPQDSGGAGGEEEHGPEKVRPPPPVVRPLVFDFLKPIRGSTPSDTEEDDEDDDEASGTRRRGSAPPDPDFAARLTEEVAWLSQQLLEKGALLAAAEEAQVAAEARAVDLEASVAVAKIEIDALNRKVAELRRWESAASEPYETEAKGLHARIANNPLMKLTKLEARFLALVGEYKRAQTESKEAAAASVGLQRDLVQAEAGLQGVTARGDLAGKKCAWLAVQNGIREREHAAAMEKGSKLISGLHEELVAAAALADAREQTVRALQAFNTRASEQYDGELNRLRSVCATVVQDAADLRRRQEAEIKRAAAIAGSKEKLHSDLAAARAERDATKEQLQRLKREVRHRRCKACHLGVHTCVVDAAGAAAGDAQQRKGSPAKMRLEVKEARAKLDAAAEFARPALEAWDQQMARQRGAAGVLAGSEEAARDVLADAGGRPSTMRRKLSSAQAYSTTQRSLSRRHSSPAPAASGSPGSARPHTAKSKPSPVATPMSMGHNRGGGAASQQLLLPPPPAVAAAAAGGQSDAGRARKPEFDVRLSQARLEEYNAAEDAHLANYHKARARQAREAKLLRRLLSARAEKAAGRQRARASSTDATRGWQQITTMVSSN